MKENDLKTLIEGQNQIIKGLEGLTGAITLLITSKQEVGTQEDKVEVQKKRGRPKKNTVVKAPTVKKTNRPKHASGTEIFSKPRRNDFEQMPEFHACKEDTKIDKKNWKGKQPTPRRDAVAIIEVTCSTCHKDIELSEKDPSLAPGLDKFVCNKCQVGKGGRK